MRLTMVRRFAVAVLGAASIAAAQSDPWVHARTSRFNIVSNAGERDVGRIAAHLEQFAAVVSRLLSAPSRPEAPVTVMAFRNARSFAPFRPLDSGQPVNISGFFQRSAHETLIALDIDAAREHYPFAVIFHEYTHLMTSEVSQRWPAWLTEGLAEF